MAENTTSQPVPVTGQPHRHPAVRRLARACIALVRWQRAQIATDPPVPGEPCTDAAAEARHD